MKNYRLTLCYDGSRYSGWQKQGNTENTIQYKLEALLSRLLSRETELAGSGRTDAGVHARRQVCSFHADTDMSCSELLAEIRRYLPEDIGAISLEEAEPRFHARLSCRGKTYVYRVWNSPEPNVFERKYVYCTDKTIDLDAMRRAAELLCGEHDFSAFTSAKRMKKSAVRRIESIEISRRGGELRFILTGNGFLYNMVRIIVGTLLEAGAGQRSIASVAEALAAKDRELAGFTAPAKGLTLWDVYY
ncbi:MAG: tRNA pseudouridine(38-40) synthase TruA [Oscillospiraceae bacterium]|nr:tRNA pseudouridine(38-40) synthase TruA [Oscillospiraceae bacterium]